MGMDAAIYKAKNKKIFKEDCWYDKVEEVWYARKFWDLIYKVPFIKNIEEDCGEFIRLRKNDIEKMIEIATHTPDYMGGFNTVPQLCEILHHFDEDEENGWHYYFEFDY